MAANATSFKPGRKKTGGRKKGIRNKKSAAFQGALWEAIEAEGCDGFGEDGAVGYLRRIASEREDLFVKLLSHFVDDSLDSYSDQNLQDEMRRRNLPTDALDRPLMKTNSRGSIRSEN